MLGRTQSAANGKLPPGSMGFPFVGETIEFILNREAIRVPPFVQKRLARHYKITTPGALFKYMKNLVLPLIGSENLKRTLLREINESTTRRHVQSWASHDVVDVTEATSTMILEYIAKRVISYDESKDARNLKENYNAFVRGIVSIPLNIPGTGYHACLQARDNIRKAIKDIFEERKASKMKHGDFLYCLLEEMRKEDNIMSEALARDIIFGILFGTYETSRLAMTMLVKFLSQHPEVVAELKKEHEAIIESRGFEKSEITWDEYKSMTFTHMVINETIRLGNILPGIFRKVVKDVQIKGYTIPAGWMVMINTTVLHLDPDKYDDPLTFNPWRWGGKEMTKSSKTFMGFGLNPRLCLGADLAKLQMAIFLHYLVLNYRWEFAKGGDIIRRPWLEFPNGLHIKISKYLE
ncbi:Cytochrome P450 87A3 [Morus notabilis]|uniref:Cytochrome P450 87A3 n=1 Tax=Morus notabilis TaxID=981085 RepID=W9R243_9ROSA|nr:Cytochrome P450 87A3 [Morus notabilis]